MYLDFLYIYAAIVKTPVKPTRGTAIIVTYFIKWFSLVNNLRFSSFSIFSTPSLLLSLNF